MIADGERLWLDISLKDTISRDEYNAFASRLSNIYGDQAKNWGLIFFSNKEVEDDKLSILNVNKTVFVPTYFHQNIEIKSAVIENEYYENNFFDTSLLSIGLEYTGKDEKMKDWNRIYVYKKDNNENWKFYAMEGILNFTESGFNPSYLPIKK